MKFAINKKMIQKIFLSILLAFTSSIFSQTLDELQFNELVHDFGRIKEESNESVHVFQFKNVSKRKIVITKVETSCGCTTPDWSKDTILPGGMGYVKAFYNPEGKKGNFQKYMYVHINRPDYFTTLTIRGDVIPRPRPDYAKSTFKLDYGNLAFSENMANFGVVLSTEVKEKTIHVFNYNEYPINIMSIGDKPDFIEIILKDSTIKAGDSINIVIRVIGNKILKMGDDFSRISLITDDPAFPEKSLFVMSRLKEDYSNLSKKDLKNAPKIKLSNGPNINLGSHPVGSKFTESVTISNTGKKDLIVYKIAPTCSCITVNKRSFTLKPGESITLVFTYDTINQMVAEHSKNVSVICNDPTNSEFNFNFRIKVTN
ncbi:MAG: DUF1573 domain-containing protein [bacterium]|nr:DUF1573 domain-containing protein [bacterium]